MKAPEKLYISDYDSEVRYNWHPERLAVNDIEYTRTDAFIEKAIEWISNNCYIPHSTLENFKKYMEGE